NTAGTDITGNNWFDNCVSATGNTVSVTLADLGGTIVYQQTDTKVNPGWTNDNITCTAPNFLQFNTFSHDRMIVLGNGDRLHIASRNSVQTGCYGSLGNGYSIFITDSTNAPQAMKLIVMSYIGGDTSAVRNFNAWLPSQEIGY